MNVGPTAEARPEAPAHGFRGDPAGPAGAYPKALTVAVSREAGARGGAVARKVGELLGWQVYDQEVLDYLLLDAAGRDRLLADLPAAARAWADGAPRVGSDAEGEGLVRLLRAVAAVGDAVVVGRGAGHLLPAETTLHVRVVAPFEDRVGYAAQLLRLTRDEAAVEVRSRDDRRGLFLARTVGRDPADLGAYDLVVNTSRLGVEGAARVVAAAVRAKHPFAEPADE